MAWSHSLHLFLHWWLSVVLYHQFSWVVVSVSVPLVLYHQFSWVVRCHCQDSHRGPVLSSFVSLCRVSCWLICTSGHIFCIADLPGGLCLFLVPAVSIACIQLVWYMFSLLSVLTVEVFFFSMERCSWRRSSFAILEEQFSSSCFLQQLWLPWKEGDHLFHSFSVVCL